MKYFLKKKNIMHAAHIHIFVWQYKKEEQSRLCLSNAKAKNF